MNRTILLDNSGQKDNSFGSKLYLPFKSFLKNNEPLKAIHN